MKIVFSVLFLILLWGCQQKPTTALEESVDVFEARTVLVDTRSALDFSSFHIKGSTNLLVEDFLILKNPLAKPQNQKRYFDSNLVRLIERLSARGIHPTKRIYLVGNQKESIENLKWKWLLNNLEIEDVYTYSIDQVRKMKKGHFAEVESEKPWTLKSSVYFQKEFILNKVQKCFVDTIKKNSDWNSKYCL